MFCWIVKNFPLRFFQPFGELWVRKHRTDQVIERATLVPVTIKPVQVSTNMLPLY